MAKNPVGWFEIYVDDFERAKKFYQDVLKVEFQKLEGPDQMWAFPMDNEGRGSSGALIHMDGFPAGIACWSISCPKIAPSKRPASFPPAAVYKRQNSRSGNTVSSRSP